ncbi:MAG: DUF58 domain-containing protein [Betaproteobacteria bacterium]
MSSLLSKEFLRRLDGLTLLLRRPVSGHLRGQHRSKRTGVGMIFSDYRPYSPGDDVRNLDWATYMRLDRLVLRLFEEEADTPIYIFIDSSNSMLQADGGKFLVAKKLAAMLSYIGLLNHDRVSLVAFSDGVVRELPGRRGKNQMWRTLHFLEALKPSGVTNYADTFKRYFGGGRTRGLVVFISDFLQQESLELSFKPIRQYGHEVFASHVISPSEVSPELGGEVVLVDSETNESMNVHLTETLLRQYRAAFVDHCSSIENFFRRSGWGYLRINTDDNFEEAALVGLKKERLTL